MNNLDREICFICKKNVLGLLGQDTFLDPYRLSRSDDDRISNEIHEAKAMGECHFLCLTNSKWGYLWAEKIKENLVETVRKPILAETDEYMFLGSKNVFKNMFSVTIIKNNGWIAELYPNDVKKARKDNDKVFMPISLDAHFDFASQVDKKQELKKMSKGGKVALIDFIRLVGVEEYLLDSTAVNNGILELTEKDSKTDNINNDSYLKTRLTYESVISVEVFDIFLRLTK